MPLDNADLEKLERFRNEIIQTFATMQLDILSITKTLREVDKTGLLRLTAKRAEVLETRAALVGHYAQAISPIR